MNRNNPNAALLSALAALMVLASPAQAVEPVERAPLPGLGLGIEWFTPPAADITADSGGHMYEEAVPQQSCSLEGSEMESRLKAKAALPRHARPVIAVVIDDMGVDRKRSARTLRLPADITLAYLPYALHVQQQVDQAAALGHEIIVHMPMEPEGRAADPGPDYLGTGMNANELRARIGRNLDAFTGYVGVNNHMGSKFTSYRPGVDVLMPILKERGLLFLDSKTRPDSVAEAAALDNGLPATHRDIFLDHVEDAAHVRQALAQAEKRALRTGTAVVIGHPKDVTIDALAAWLPTLSAKGIRVVKLSDVIARRHPRATAAAVRHEQRAN